VKALKIALALLLGVAVLAGGLLASGALPLSAGNSESRPGCGHLPDRQAVSSAIDAHASMVQRILSAGPGVRVAVSTPCSERPDQALVGIRYSGSSERRNVETVLDHDTGFGVPVQLLGR
jgi:hypothetical protein